MLDDASNKYDICGIIDISSTVPADSKTTLSGDLAGLSKRSPNINLALFAIGWSISGEGCDCMFIGLVWTMTICFARLFAQQVFVNSKNSDSTLSFLPSSPVGLKLDGGAHSKRWNHYGSLTNDVRASHHSVPRECHWPPMSLHSDHRLKERIFVHTVNIQLQRN